MNLADNTRSSMVKITSFFPYYVFLSEDFISCEKCR